MKKYTVFFIIIFKDGSILKKKDNRVFDISKTTLSGHILHLSNLKFDKPIRDIEARIVFE